MRTVTYDLRMLLQEAGRHAFVIPRFQRDFIWNQAQVKLLVDSIARNYPIGSLLMLAENNPRDPFLHSRPVDALLHEDCPDPECSDRAEDAGTKVHYVLDGQQRLTSIVRVFLQGSHTDCYYFDLQRMLQFDDDKTQTAWVVRRARTTRMTRRYLRSDTITNPEQCQVVVEEYFENEEPSVRGDRNAQRRASARVNRVFETMRNYQVPLVVIDRDESVEAICRIFETINSTGTRLTTFDLAVARFFPNPDLHQLWNDSKQSHEVLDRYAAEGERVLQVISLLLNLERGTWAEASRSAILALPRAEVERRWLDASTHLSEAYAWAEERGATPGNLANEAILVPLAVFFSLIDDRWKHAHPGFAAYLDKWYFANVLQQGAKQATNYRIALTTNELWQWATGGPAPDVPAVSLAVDDVLKLRESDNRYRALHALMRWKARRDIWTDEELRPDDVEDHHIFPAALAKRREIPKRLLDGIANKLLVSKSTNRRLKDQMPRDYVGRLIRAATTAGTREEKRAMLEAACFAVPEADAAMEESLDINNVQNFVTERANRIVGLVAQVLGDKHRDSLVEDEDE